MSEGELAETREHVCMFHRLAVAVLGCTTRGLRSASTSGDSLRAAADLDRRV